MYSSITKKKCKHEGCKRYPTISLKGYCWEHAPEEVKSKFKDKKDLSKKNKYKRQALSRKIYVAANEAQFNSYRQWFLDRREEMTGVCKNCGNQTFKNDEIKFTWSIAHLLEKRHFKSVSVNPHNWIELCWSCHTDMDNKGGSHMATMNCWNLIKQRFEILYPLIRINEHQYISPTLLTTLNR